MREKLAEQPDSLIKATGLRSLGDVFRQIGDLELSKEVLGVSLKVARGLRSPLEESAALLSLGNTERAIANRKRSSEEAFPVQPDKDSFETAL